MRLRGVARRSPPAMMTAPGLLRPWPHAPVTKATDV